MAGRAKHSRIGRRHGLGDKYVGRDEIIGLAFKNELLDFVAVAVESAGNARMKRGLLRESADFLDQGSADVALPLLYRRGRMDLRHLVRTSLPQLFSNFGEVTVRHACKAAADIQGLLGK